jgi:hypothetical protein
MKERRRPDFTLGTADAFLFSLHDQEAAQQRGHIPTPKNLPSYNTCCINGGVVSIISLKADHFLGMSTD